MRLVLRNRRLRNYSWQSRSSYIPAFCLKRAHLPLSMRCFTVCSSVILLFVSLAGEVMAQAEQGDSEIIREATSSGSNKNALGGLGEDAVLARFGEPDSKKDTGTEASEWRYGSSVVFLERRKVTAVLDAGDLDERLNLQAVKIPPKRKVDPFRGAWENPWTPSKKNVEALDELMKDPK